jgi:Na+-transporting NADH:ubiquinone oxidoreductase subunit NqrB
MVFVAATLTATAFAVRRFAHRLLGFLAAPRPSLMASIGLDRVLAKQSISIVVILLCGIVENFRVAVQYFTPVLDIVRFIAPIVVSLFFIVFIIEALQ